MTGTIPSPLGTVALGPADAGSLGDLGMRLGYAGNARSGYSWLVRSVALEPHREDLCEAAAALSLRVAAWATALRLLRRCVALSPQRADLQIALARAEAARSPTSGVHAVRRAQTISPADAAIWRVAAALARQSGRLATARAAARIGVALLPSGADALAEAALASHGIGDPEAGEGLLARACTTAPDRSDLVNQLALVRAYTAPLDRLFHAVCLHAAVVSRGIAPIAATVRAPEPNRRLRIGYVSSDLRDHPIGHVLIGPLEAHDRDRFEVTIYCSAVRTDAMSEQFAACARRRQVYGLDDRTVASLIRTDGIDVLVHVAARFSGNRPDLAAYRAAPVQLAIFDVTSSGHQAITATVTDADLHPLDSRERFIEPVIRIPTGVAYLRPPALAIAPCREDGVVVFGSANNPAKWSAATLSLWSEVLAAVPSSRLWLKFHARTSDPPTRAALSARLAEHGLPLDRVDYDDTGTAKDFHLAALSKIDIVLDPLPFGGATASFEALWMGVPVVTLAGDRMMSRTSAMLLRHLGLEDLVARDRADYIAIASRLAGDLDRRRRLRAELRSLMECSGLLNATTFVRSLETIYRVTWAAACSRHQELQTSR